ncbi:hypothetical protein WDW86_13470 [Bdellovibrionota bacterium FG-2]
MLSQFIETLKEKSVDCQEFSGDSEMEDIRLDIEALDQYLKIQNLRRVEEKRFIQLMQMRQLSFVLAIIVGLYAFPDMASAASFEGSLQNLVSSVVGRILPIVALLFVGKNIFAHIQNEPDATQESVRVSLGVVALLGINGVWGWLQGQVR